MRLYPLYHPAAALYTPATLEALRADFVQIPQLLTMTPVEQPEPLGPMPDLEPDAEDDSNGSGGDENAAPAQLGLF